MPFLLHQPSGCRVNPETGEAISKTGKVISGQAKGYFKINVSRFEDGKKITKIYLIHRIIWELARGPIPEKMEVNHINGVKHDNRIENLEVVTSKQNHDHAVRLGLAGSGETGSNAKLTWIQVLEVRRTTGEIKGSEWARRLGVTRATIYAIRGGLSWKHSPPLLHKTLERFGRSFQR